MLHTAAEGWFTTRDSLRTYGIYRLSILRQMMRPCVCRVLNIAIGSWEDSLCLLVPGVLPLPLVYLVSTDYRTVQVSLISFSLSVSTPPHYISPSGSSEAPRLPYTLESTVGVRAAGVI